MRNHMEVLQLIACGKLWKDFTPANFYYFIVWNSRKLCLKQSQLNLNVCAVVLYLSVAVLFPKLYQSPKSHRHMKLYALKNNTSH